MVRTSSRLQELTEYTKKQTSGLYKLILKELNIEPKQWNYLTQNFENPFKSFVGGAFKLKQVCQSLGYKRIPGIKSCQNYFP